MACPCPEPEETNSLPHIQFFKIYLNIIFLSMQCGLSPADFLAAVLCAFDICGVLATCQ